jgi:uncharacterized protein YdeI (YjbR/CyaY-like superfamily)
VGDQLGGGALVVADDGEIRDADAGAPACVEERVQRSCRAIHGPQSTRRTTPSQRSVKRKSGDSVSMTSGRAPARDLTQPDQVWDAAAPSAACHDRAPQGPRMTDAPKNPQVAQYIEELSAWRDELEALRPLLLGAGLDEEFKWSKPCYVHEGSNVVIFQPFNELCALLFFKGALLDDPDGALKEQGENTRSALRLEFRSVADVTAAKRTIAALVEDAIRVEDAGLAVAKPADDGPYPEELVLLLDADAGLRDAWERLTPGRRRGWLLHFNGAKQSKTRVARIERATPRILEGFGMHD